MAKQDKTSTWEHLTNSNRITKGENMNNVLCIECCDTRSQLYVCVFDLEGNVVVKTNSICAHCLSKSMNYVNEQIMKAAYDIVQHESLSEQNKSSELQDNFIEDKSIDHMLGVEIIH